MIRSRRWRPQLTFQMMQWALVDVVGLSILAIGGLYLVRGRAAFTNFPSSTVEAVALVAAGVVLVFVAAVKMLAEVLAQQPPMVGIDAPPDADEPAKEDGSKS